MRIPRRLAVALYGAAQAAPDRVVRGRVLAGRAGLGFAPEGAPAADPPFAPLFAEFRSQPEGAPPPDAAELERLLATAPLLLVASRATRGVMVLEGWRRAASGIEKVGVEIE